MLTNWGVAAAGLAAAIGLSVGQPPPSIPNIPIIPEPSGPVQPPSSSDPKPGGSGGVEFPTRTQLQLKVERDGLLTVEETITVRSGEKLNRRSPLRIKSGDMDRVFVVRDPKLEGNGSAQATADEFTVSVGEGKSVLRYQVEGAVIDLGDRQEVRWQLAAGWDAHLSLLRATFIAPEIPISVRCNGGPYGTERPCRRARTDNAGVTRVDVPDLSAGDRVDLAVGLPLGTVPANAKLVEPETGAGPFALTSFSGFGLLGLTVLLLGGIVLLWVARGRDAKVLATDVGPVDVLVRDKEGVAFASPDGVLPGQIGTVTDERVDPVDITATVLDLAVRNYLWIQEISQDDWQIVRRNPADDSLTAYERAVYETIPEQGGTVSTLSVSTLSVDMDRIKDAMYTDVAQREWFKRRPDQERTRWMAVGIGLAFIGAGLTAVLALTVGNALLGLAVVIAGVALALGARLMPARTKRGSVLLAQVRSLRGYLQSATPSSIPENDRELVFSRSLPYAVVLGESPRWLEAFASAGELYWFSGGRNLPGFITAMDRALAK
ncbi:DUF2207 domain-containing protein [Kibdelosporangium aridum]|uniref:DUF2207 domain-containing protein n=1 Tax=Kibdelosporangium aridum TaxID=2030 RepID=UPI0007C50C86|nr:DUF2207 domain-containing protein [Kibdelosporangium aridum]